MTQRPLTLATLSALAALLAGCASSMEGSYAMDARYEASLEHWRGATESQLLASWGKPTMLQDFPEGRIVVFVVRHDINTGNNPRNFQVPTITAFGAPVISAGMTAAPVVPVTCTTRFMIQEGVVSSWRFEGLGCGAPQ